MGTGVKKRSEPQRLVVQGSLGASMGGGEGVRWYYGPWWTWVKRRMQVAVCGEAGMKGAKGRAKALPGMLGGTVFKGTVESKGTGTDVQRRTRSETQRSAGGWGAVVHQREGVCV